jgi:hypothetical protein
VVLHRDGRGKGGQHADEHVHARGHRGGEWPGHRDGYGDWGRTSLHPHGDHIWCVGSSISWPLFGRTRVTLNFTGGSEEVSGGTLTYAFVFTQTGDAGSGAGTASAICTNGDASLASQGTTCSAQPVDGGFPPFVPPNQPRSVCTPAQIEAYYDACWAPGWTDATCDPFSGDPANSPCIRCMYGDATAKSWGAVIDYHGDTFTNIAGCIALVDGDSSATGCGAAYQTFQECDDAACNACTTSTTYDQCEAVADFGVCQTYAQATMCSQANEYDGCFFADFESYFRGIGQFFCAAASPTRAAIAATAQRMR